MIARQTLADAVRLFSGLSLWESVAREVSARTVPCTEETGAPMHDDLTNSLLTGIAKAGAILQAAGPPIQRDAFRVDQASTPNGEVKARNGPPSVRCSYDRTKT